MRSRNSSLAAPREPSGDIPRRIKDGRLNARKSARAFFPRKGPEGRAASLGEARDDAVRPKGEAVFAAAPSAGAALSDGAGDVREVPGDAAATRPV